MKTIRTDKKFAVRTNAIRFAGVVAMVLFWAVALYPVRAVATTSNAAGEASGTEVKIDNFAFNPAVITVKAGTQVTWINKDDIPHTVDSSEGKFKSAALDTDQKFEFKFSEPGEYPFFCRMHPKMTGKVIVQP